MKEPLRIHVDLDEFFDQIDYTPERALIAAVLFRAVRDISNMPGEVFGQQFRSNNMDITEGHRMQARCWFLSESEEFLTYLDCCSVLGIDGKRFRKALHGLGWLTVPAHLK